MTQESDALLIAVVGLTGVGKTTFINLASSSELRVGHDIVSCTAEVQLSEPFVLDDKRVILIDTPGFDDTTKTEVEILQLIVKNLTELYSEDRKLSGIIFLHRITDVRMGGVATKNFRLFRRLCGESSLRNVVIATSWWNTVDKETGEHREAQLAGDERFFKPALDKGARLSRHTDSLDSAYEIIRQVLHLPPVVLRIQQEIVDEKKTLSETGAGKEINKELEMQVQKYQAEISELKEEMCTMKSGYEDDIKEIKEDQEKARKKWEEAQQEIEKLRSEKFEEAMNEIRGSIVTMERENEELGKRLNDAEMARKEAERHNKKRGGC